jgi:hypothetical protein
MLKRYEPLYWLRGPNESVAIIGAPTASVPSENPELVTYRL